MSNVTAYLCANGAAEAIEFYKKAFGAEEKFRLVGDDGRVGHAEIVIEGTVLFLADEYAEYNVLSPNSLKGSSVSFVVSVADVDAAWGRAIGAGARVERPIVDSPHGRGGWLIDPFGHRWNLMAPNPDYKPEDTGSF
jgi:PhnB protein